MLRIAATVLVALALALTARGAVAEYQFVVNGEFDTGIGAWTPSGSNVTWLPGADANGDPSSGGAELRTPAGGTIAAGAYQCLPAAENIPYTMRADARVPLASQSAGTYMYIFRVYYGAQECSNTIALHSSDVTSTAIDGWQQVESVDTAPPGTVSMWVYIVLYKGTPGVESYGYVDNISVTAPSDSDLDGCSDGEELGPNEIFGGQRNPHDTWDFYDVDGSQTIDLADTVAVLNRFGLAPPNPGYEARYDRYVPDQAHPWRTAAATGSNIGIDVADAIANLRSFGHNCAN